MKNFARVCVAFLFFFLLVGSAAAQPSHKHGPSWRGGAPSATSTAAKKKAAPPTAKAAPLTQEERLRIAEGGKAVHNGDPPPPKANVGDSLGYRAREAAAKAEAWVKPAAKAVGSTAALIIFHILMIVIPLVVIILIPGLAAGKWEMTIEAILIFIAGIIMLAADWVGELNLAGWVWFCLILPAVVLFLVSFKAKEGAWKFLLVLGPPILMNLIALLGILNSAMNALVHGSLVAVGVLILVLYLLVRDKPARAATN